MVDVILDIIVSAVIILVVVVAGLVVYVLALSDVLHPLLALLHIDETATMLGAAFGDEKQRAMLGLLDNGRELLRCGDWERAKVQFDTALIVEPNLTKKLTKEHRAALLSELVSAGEVTESLRIRKILCED